MLLATAGRSSGKAPRRRSFYWSTKRRTTPDPHQNVLSYRQSTCAAAANLLDWNRAVLTRQ